MCVCFRDICMRKMRFLRVSVLRKMHYDTGEERQEWREDEEQREARWQGSDGGMVMSGGREDGGYVACRERGWRDEGVMEGWWEYREKEERGEQQWEGRRRNTMSSFVFILIHGSVRGGRYLLIILLYYLTLKAKKQLRFSVQIFV